MDWSNFIVIGENIHCTRIVKRGGSRTAEMAAGGEAVTFKFKGEDRLLPVPPDWARISPAYDQGNIKHAALGIYQALHGDAENAATGRAYLCWMAERQINAGATYLDVNVDEYSNDAAEAREAMAFITSFLGERYSTPLSIDSSHPETLRTGLQNCRRDIRPPMVNSVSLERVEAAELVKEFDAEVIVNAAGRQGMPNGTEERMENFREIIAIMAKVGIAPARMHLDPLVLPISTDPMNGMTLLDTNRQTREEFPETHLNGGLSNISFGMPNRKLLNMVFTWLCVESGTDGGIIDPVSMPVTALAGLDPASTEFQLAKAVLTGEDMFGMEYITAHREGRI
jgi:hypothetical protein